MGPLKTLAGVALSKLSYWGEKFYLINPRVPTLSENTLKNDWVDLNTRKSMRFENLTDYKTLRQETENLKAQEIAYQKLLNERSQRFEELSQEIKSLEKTPKATDLYDFMAQDKKIRDLKKDIKNFKEAPISIAQPETAEFNEEEDIFIEENAIRKLIQEKETAEKSLAEIMKGLDSIQIETKKLLESKLFF